MDGVMAADECLVDDEGEACVGEDEELSDARREDARRALRRAELGRRLSERASI